MDEGSFTILIVAIGGVLAIANAWRGAVLVRAGEKQRGSRHMAFAAALLMLTTVALLLRS